MKKPSRPVVYPDDQAWMVVMRPDGDSGVLINPRFGWTPQQVAEILDVVAGRLRLSSPAEFSQPQAP